MSLEDVAARMVMRAHQLERALHDPGPWTMTVGANEDQWRIPARKVVGEDHVTFYAVVPLDEDRVYFTELNCGDDIVAVKIMDSVGGRAQVAWTFEVREASVSA